MIAKANAQEAPAQYERPRYGLSHAHYTVEDGHGQSKPYLQLDFWQQTIHERLSADDYGGAVVSCIHQDSFDTLLLQAAYSYKTSMLMLRVLSNISRKSRHSLPLKNRLACAKLR